MIDKAQQEEKYDTGDRTSIEVSIEKRSMRAG